MHIKSSSIAHCWSFLYSAAALRLLFQQASICMLVVEIGLEKASRLAIELGICATVLQDQPLEARGPYGTFQPHRMDPGDSSYPAKESEQGLSKWARARAFHKFHASCSEFSVGWPRDD